MTEKSKLELKMKTEYADLSDLEDSKEEYRIALNWTSKSKEGACHAIIDMYINRGLALKFLGLQEDMIGKDRRLLRDAVAGKRYKIIEE